LFYALRLRSILVFFIERQRLQQALDGLSGQAWEALQQRFLQHYQDNRFLQRWIKQGFEHRVVQSLFRAFAAEELLREPREGEFEAFVVSRGEELASFKGMAVMGK
jgi:uncharacterized membrane protein YheB (UPF0754 family)